MIKKKILIFGAGAIGRGFLGNILSNHELSFVDKNKNLINFLKKNKEYLSITIKKRKYNYKKIKIKDAFHLSENFNIKKYDIIFSCVGTNQCFEIAHLLQHAKKIISCENDPNTVSIIKKISKNKNVYFAVPDVITSNTAPKKILVQNPWTVISEDGMLVVKNNEINLPSPIKKLSKKNFEMHWICKLFIHNAPHAITAYLGAYKKYQYIHEAMADKKIFNVIKGSIKEITDAVINTGLASKKFATNYKNKELLRFSNKLLFDPISRVAREPIRKLSPNNRIVLALRLSIFNKRMPYFTALGIKAAMNYFDINDKESIHLQNLLKTYSEGELLEKISHINLGDPLNKFCVETNIKDYI